MCSLARHLAWERNLTHSFRLRTSLGHQDPTTAGHFLHPSCADTGFGDINFQETAGSSDYHSFSDVTRRFTEAEPWSCLHTSRSRDFTGSDAGRVSC